MEYWPTRKQDFFLERPAKDAKKHGSIGPKGMPHMGARYAGHKFEYTAILFKIRAARKGFDMLFIY